MGSPRLERCKESQKDHVMIGAIFLRCAATPQKKCSVPPLQTFRVFGIKNLEKRQKLRNKHIGKSAFLSPSGLVAMTSASHAEGRQFNPAWVFVIDFACKCTRNQPFQDSNALRFSFCVFFVFVSASFPLCAARTWHLSEQIVHLL